MITLAQRAQHEKPIRPLVLIFDADEEGEVDGAENVLKHHRFHDAWVIIPEATDNTLSLGQRACLDFRVRTKGFALPSSLATNNRENSALYRANRILDALIHDEETRINKLSDRHFGKGIQSIGQIRGGTASNAVADRVEFWGTRRLLPSQDLADEAKQLRRLVRTADPTATVAFPFRGEGFLTESGYPLVRSLRPLLDHRETTYQSGWTEAGAFQHWGEVVVFGPGESAVTHTANESLKLQQLTDYTTMITKFVFG